MRFGVVLVLMVLLCQFVMASEVEEVHAAKTRRYEAIDLHPFLDGMSHWRKRYGRDRNDAMYDPTQIVHIAENLLVYQVVEDPNAPPLWARFHEIGTNRPFMANRDGIKVYSLSEVALERRTGYAWYGGWPIRVLEKDYPAWKARLNSK